ncbi:MarR family transcriptional regulator [Streptomyces sp. NPDC059063]|uniref:MarR family transcriptional regulator n=1 Tax=unclassified Streptomyces TaxID=2593676 RepID=UPI0036C6CD31
MSDLHGLLGTTGHALLSRTLAQCEADAVTGAVRVLGRPGGVFHLSRGRVVAVVSPGAPGLEVLLLRSGRLSDEAWEEAVASGRGGGGTGAGGVGRVAGDPGAELVARGAIGAAELRVLSVMALRDAVFAVLAGEISECATTPDRVLTADRDRFAAADRERFAAADRERCAAADRERCAATERNRPAPPPPSAARGEEPARLLQEAARKLTALAALPGAVLPDRHRLRQTTAIGAHAATRAETLAPVRREILYFADGRRTPRDIAFTSGRGVYTVTVEASRMLGEGLLERAGPSTPAPAPGPSPAPLSRRAPTRAPEPPADDLPRRSPGASGMTGTLAAGHPAASWKGLLRWGSRNRSTDPGT